MHIAQVVTRLRVRDRITGKRLAFGRSATTVRADATR